jgi:fatty-acyl-CoA synthase
MLTFNEIIESFSRAVPTKVVVKDENRKLSYKELETNGTKLSNYFLKLGISKGDRIALLAYNCIEYAEIFYATAKIGAIITPINFRLSLKEVIDVWYDSSPKCLIIQNTFKETYFELLKKKIIDTKKTIIIGNTSNEFVCTKYSDIIENKIIKFEGNFNLSIPKDDWSLMYTSGTTGRPKGVVRNHNGYYLLAAITAIELSISKQDNALIVMPLCHANSFNFFCAYIFAGASVSIYSKKSFEPAHFFDLVALYGSNFTSLVPTHYIILLDYIKKKKLSQSIERNFKFMISSAPARRDTKKSILKFFKSAKLYELYGSSESGWVTMLHPSEQFEKLGTVGRECIGTKSILILDENKKEVKDGCVGELYASTPYNFSHYWKNKSKTNDAFFKDYVTVGDLACRTKDGYIKLVDRKKNMIISGGENIYPAEVENILGSNENIKDVAIVGDEDDKWGEIVCAFVVLEEGVKLSQESLIKWSKERLAGYKCPKKVFFIKDNDMPRNTTGKILHKELRRMVRNKNDY